MSKSIDELRRSWRESNAKYRKKIRMVTIALNKDSDADVISALKAVDNVQAYIKSLIRKDMGSKARAFDVGYAFEDGYTTWTIKRINGDDVLVESPDGFKKAIKLSDVEV